MCDQERCAATSRALQRETPALPSWAAAFRSCRSPSGSCGTPGLHHAAQHSQGHAWHSKPSAQILRPHRCCRRSPPSSAPSGGARTQGVGHGVGAPHLAPGLAVEPLADQQHRHRVALAAGGGAGAAVGRRLRGLQRKTCAAGAPRSRQPAPHLMISRLGRPVHLTATSTRAEVPGPSSCATAAWASPAKPLLACDSVPTACLSSTLWAQPLQHGGVTGGG